MELATINAKGQITLPMSVRKHLKLSSGDRIAFVREGEKVIITSNPAVAALKEVQAAFQGAAEEAGLRNEDDVVRMVKEIRAERQKNQA